jgi:transcriptional regulator with XRE-family HTH domain
MINLESIKYQLSKKNHTVIGGSPIGSIIKLKRKQLNMTLEETADGICCVSYLSKVENNQLQISDEIRDDLFRVLNIDDSKILFSISFEEDVSKLLKSNLYKSINLELSEDAIDTNTKLLRMLMYVLDENYEQASLIHSEIEPYIKSLSDMESDVFLYTTAMLFSNSGLYYDAFCSLKEIKSSESNLLMTLVKYERLILAIKIDRVNYVFRNYHSVEDELLKNVLFKHLESLKFEYLCFTMKIRTNEHVMELIDKFPFVPNRSLYVSALFDFVNKFYKRGYTMIKSAMFSEERMFALAAMLLYKDKNYEELARVIDEYPRHTIVNKNAAVLIDYLKVKVQKSTKSTLAFINKHLLALAVELSDNLIINFLFDEAYQDCKRSYYYKVATKITDIKNDLVNKLMYDQKRA